MSPARQGLVYGVGALQAAARGERMVWAVHRAALSNGIVPVVPAGAIAEAYRTEARGDRLEALLAGTVVEPLGDERCAAGRRAGRPGRHAGHRGRVGGGDGGPTQRGGGAPRDRALRRAWPRCSRHDLVLYAPDRPPSDRPASARPRS